MKDHQPCPACMALSFWLGNNCSDVATSVGSHLRRLDLLRHLPPSDTAFPSPLRHLRLKSSSYELDLEFQQKTYRIALCLSFFRLLVHCLFLCEQWFNKCKQRDFGFPEFDAPTISNHLNLFVSGYKLHAYVDRALYQDSKLVKRLSNSPPLNACRQEQTQLVNAGVEVLILDTYLANQNEYAVVEEYALDYL